jgi:hypothetical protein
MCPFLSLATAIIESKFFDYDVHCRFKTILSTSISGRLFLAAIYFATSASSFRESRICMTGHEHAMKLVRGKLDESAVGHSTGKYA